MRLFEVGVQPVGFIALGALPTGVIAIGQGATGVIAVGQLARGVVAVGQLSLGIFAFGQLALGAAWAGGQVAVGGTQGLAMLGWGAVGDWLPWKGEAPKVRPARALWSVALRAALLAGLVALVAWLALAPVVDALGRAGGVFVPGPGMS
jgi:hypothetical protein